MSALVNALDTMTATPLCIGEKGHAEYSWSNDIREKIVQFSFQLVRTYKTKIAELKKTLTNLLTTIMSAYKRGDIVSGVYQDYMITLYKMVGQTRDIIDGKGEYALSYMLIVTWYNFFPELAKYALKKFVMYNDDHPYGSWKDIKYFCQYCKDNNVSEEHHLMIYAMELLNDQLMIDNANRDAGVNNISLAARWAPREGKQFSWLFRELAKRFYSNYLTTADSYEKKQKALTKCYMDYRKLLSKLNKHLDTVQIKQCSNQWSSINHALTTSITHTKQKQAFLNIDARGNRRIDSEDRIECAKSYMKYVDDTINSGKNIKGKRTGINMMAKGACRIISHKQRQGNWTDELKCEADILNSQWKDSSSETVALDNMIAMVDFSGSMEGDPIHCAMALGCRVAEKSKLGKRVLSFSNNPTWHNLDNCNGFVEMIEVLQRGEIGYSTRFYNAMKIILDAIIEKKMTPEEVDGLTLGIFSDMQIDQAEQGQLFHCDALYKNISVMFEDAGKRLHGIPFKPPHILFWNLRSTIGFPCLTTQTNVSMFSGFSPALLNLFCEKGINGLQTCTPWSQLMASMDSHRYKCLENQAKEFFQVN